MKWLNPWFLTIFLLPSVAWASDVFDEIAGSEPAAVKSEEKKETVVKAAPQLSYTYRLVQRILRLESQQQYLDMYVEMSGPEGKKISADDQNLLLAFLSQKAGLNWVASYWLRQTPMSQKIDIDILNLWRPNVNNEVLRLSQGSAREITLGQVLMDVSGVKLTQRSSDFYLSQWREFLSLLTQDKVQSAVQVLRAHFIKKDSEGAQFISKDELNINVARALYQAGYLDDAIRYYENIEKSSPMWLVSLEEKSWAELRSGRVANAMAHSKTLISPFLQSYIHPEAYYLSALSALKVCNYTDVSQLISDYKMVFQPRYKSIQSELKSLAGLSLGKTYKSILAIKEAKEINLNLAIVEREISSIGAIQSEVATVTKAHKRLKQTELEAYQPVRNYLAEKAEALLSRLRGKVLTQLESELEDIKSVTEIMHVVEAEMLQQVIERQTFTKVTAKDKEIQSDKNDPYALVFPKEDNDMWFDELDSYQVKTASLCLSKIQGGENETITQ